MAISRYRQTEVVLNDLEEHEELLRLRGKKFVMQHRSRELKIPEIRDIAALNQKMHLWKQADRYWKLADRYYNDPRYWWVIAQYNQKPTEAFISNGDIIIVPMPLHQALQVLGY